MGALTTQTQADIMEQVIIKGDLAQLTPAERVNYYRAVCESIGLNPLTKPFEYINLKGRLTLYARKDATDQLRKINRISIGKPDITFKDDLIVVAIAARDPQGREDSDIGVVKKSDMGGDVANALMKAVTKAKRRVTLSLCGLGWLDETEIETIPDARPVIISESGDLGPQWPDAQAVPAPEPPEPPAPATEASRATNGVNVKSAKLTGPVIEPFGVWCGEWVKDARASKYAHERGGPNMYHILGRVAKLGFAEVTAENIEAVKAALQKHIESEAK